MIKDNSVVFKGDKDGISIILDESASFEHICDILRQKIKSSQKFFQGANLSIAFKGKELVEAQILELLDIIGDEAEIAVDFVDDLTGKLRVSESTLPPKPEVFMVPNTYFHNGNLRSGQTIVHSGTVVVMGDVSAGAEITATENVIVMGTLRGLVQAGSGGLLSAYISAVSLQPNQYLSVAGKKMHFTKEMLEINKEKKDPEYVFIADGQIHISSMSNFK